jgi:chemotaxis protein histidine kinase CheA
MEDSRNGYRKFLEIQVEGLQDQLYALERDPEQTEHLKAILRVCQRLRHAQDPGEPETVRILRNALEKVTLHLGRAGLAVTRDFLDFFVDTFDLLEQAVRRWPGGPSFDRARYADRVRGLLETTAPRRRAAVEGLAEPEADAQAPSGAAAGLWHPVRHPVMAEEPVGPEVAEGIELTEPESSEAAEPAGVGEAQAAHEDVPTWRVREPERLEVLRAEDLTGEEHAQFAEVDLRDLLTEPWRGRGQEAREPVGAGAPGGGELEGSALAASFSTYETLRGGATTGEAGFEEAALSTAPAGVSAEVQEALTRLRDVLDAFSLSLTDLEAASERLLGEEPGGLDGVTLSALLERLDAEKEKLLSGFDRAIESLRSGPV